MRLVRECFECGDIAQHWHHVLPASIGGTRMVPLCRDCHTAIHAPGQPLSIRNLRAITRVSKKASRKHATKTPYLECDWCTGEAVTVTISPYCTDPFSVFLICEHCTEDDHGYQFSIRDYEPRIKEHILVSKSNGWPIVYEIERRLRGGAPAWPEQELEEAV